MLPINRWPEYLWRYTWALLRPHRTAIELTKRVARQWSLNRQLNDEVQKLRQRLEEVELDRARLSADLANETAKRLAALASFQIADERAAAFESSSKHYAAELVNEKERHGETSQLLKIAQADLAVAARQTEGDQHTIQAYQERDMARARASAMRYRPKGGGGEE
jgi:chromosome segregation ATPase